MIRKGVVIPLEMTGKRKNYYKAGDVVTENDIEGDWNEKVKKGWIKETTSKEDIEKAEQEQKEAEAEAKAKQEQEDAEAKAKAKELLKAEIKEELEVEIRAKIAKEQEEAKEDIKDEEADKDIPSAEDVANLVDNNSEDELRDMLSKLTDKVPSSWKKSQLAEEIIRLSE